MKLLDVFRTILRDTISDDLADEDVLMRAVVLHTHSVALPAHLEIDDVLESERSGARFVLAPLTRTHIASLLAELWPSGVDRGRDQFWLSRYERDTPYELFDDVPADRRDHAIAARMSIEAHPLVDELIPE
jgi:hypothetical protein